MSANPASFYGRDIRCVHDADSLWSEVEGLDLLYQDAIHRLTVDDILGDDGTGSLVIVGWGYDVRRLLGMPSSQLAAQQPQISAVLQKDPRILSADVSLTAVTTNGLDDVQLEIICNTALGPFSLVKKVSDLVPSDLVGQP